MIESETVVVIVIAFSEIEIVVAIVMVIAIVLVIVEVDYFVSSQELVYKPRTAYSDITELHPLGGVSNLNHSKRMMTNWKMNDEGYHEFFDALIG